jgi:hypothetical protein
VIGCKRVPLPPARIMPFICLLVGPVLNNNSEGAAP